MDKAGYRLAQVSVVAEMGSTEAIRQAIKSRLGISILSECAVADELAEGSLKKVKIKGVPFKRAFYLVFHKHRTQSPLCRAFIAFLEGKSGLGKK